MSESELRATCERVAGGDAAGWPFDPALLAAYFLRLIAENAELRAALKPFADYAGIVWDGAHPLNPIGDACPPPPDKLDPAHPDFNAKPLPTIGDCRRAAALLAGTA
jgi:hypothetical protein